MVEIVGRDVELGLADAFLADADEGVAGLVLEGAAGIGKSTLWLDVAEQARARGFRVLVARPAEAERELGHAALGDLLEGALDEVVSELSAPRRRALEGALLRAGGPVEPVDERALAVGVRDALQLLAERTPLLVAVDDVQWVDTSSTSALAFALRRIDAGVVRVLLARRLTDEAQPGRLEEALAADRIVRLQVGALSVGALHRLMRGRVGRAFPRQTLLRIHETSGGNPFFALELARALGDDVDPVAPLPLPETLEALLHTRIDQLPAPTRGALAFVSALGTPSRSLLERAGVAAGTLEPALSAHLIERDGETIRFTHPLLGSAVYQGLGEERARIHGQIAEIVDDPLLQARHLALSTEPPDEAVAETLDEAARLAADRGASASAAELAEQALRLTSPNERDSRHRRALVAARAHLKAGEWTRARTIAHDLVANASAGSHRAEALLLLAEFEHDDLAVPVLEKALREPALEPSLEVCVLLTLAWAKRFRKSFTAAAESTREALDLADRIDDDLLRFDALAQLVILGSMVGDPDLPTHAERARRLAADADDEHMVREANLLLAETIELGGDVGQARAILEIEYRKWQDRHEPFSADAASSLAWLELWSGYWEAAAEYAEHAFEIRLQYGVEKNQDYIPSAWIALHRGQLNLALEKANRGLQLCEEQIGFHPPLLEAVPGIVALWRGDLTTAVERLAESERQARALGWSSPDQRPWTAEYVEALLGLGRVDEAAHLVDAWEADAMRLRRERVLAQVMRCRGLIAAVLGDVEQAESLLEHAADRSGEAGDAFGRGRALLGLGIVGRRARRKRPAREALEAALVEFERLGAATWVDTARAELGRIGGRSRDDGLTAAERRVATLVAAGKTNREVAAALFLAERTVAGHLTHVYSKLGIRSRTELARRLS
jgi:DNA-binding CsgD family transcriptional regulator